MSAGPQSVGTVGDSGVLISNRVPYLDIKYPIPHIVRNYSEKTALATCNDVIKEGLNFYESIASIEVKETQTTKPNAQEIAELKSVLMRGVIYNGSSS